ncbi:Yku80p [Sugiyamaella lignohabitans]|uniref:ATP-dependent DNA helicase II subunit 2 n=1 Tax=Sugiyamaella lignohabitans TaxID=796027 RepID=A0A167EC69_9ASCO|nr:Yku80p [Sugiyamaella lignohabitans]ANB13894.1 Yku80p [Sugiyamaella lignohabitans]
MICLITNGTGEMDFKKVPDLVKRLKAANIVLRILMIGMKDSGDELTTFEKEIRQSNIEELQNIERDYYPPDSDGRPDDMYMFAPYEEAYFYVSKPVVQPVGVLRQFKGVLRLGRPTEDSESVKHVIDEENTITIPVYGYPCTRRTRVPTAKSVIVKRKRPDDDGGESEDDEFNDRKVTVHFVRDYYVEKVKDENGEGEQNPDNRIILERQNLLKGYRFGSEIVTFDAETKKELSSIHLSNSPELSIYGFCSAKDVPRWYLMEASDYIVVSPEARKKDQLAMSAMILTLQLDDRVAIARYVAKPEKDAHMVLLSPYVDVDFQALILNILPFSQDYRKFQFPSLLEIKSKSGKILPPDNPQRINREPTTEMNDLMSHYIDEMDLEHAGEPDEDGEPTEYMTCEDTFNPVLHRLRNAIKVAGLTGAKNFVPPVWPELVKYSHPPAGRLDQLKPTTDRLSQLLDIKVVETKKSEKQKVKQEAEASKRVATDTDIKLEDLLS